MTLKGSGIAYIQFVRVHLIGITRFRIDFFIGVLASLLENVLALVFLTVLFAHVNVLEGYRFGDLLLMFAFATLGRSVHLVLFDNLWVLGSRYIKQGDLDRVLVRPHGVLFQIVADRVNVQALGQVAAGIGALAWGANAADVRPGIAEFLLVLMLVASSGLIFVLVHLLCAAISFWVIDSSAIMGAVFSLSSFGQYPIGIFPALLSGVIVSVIPFAFTGYVPSVLLTDGLQLGWCLGLAAVLAVLFVAAGQAWRRGLQRYAGAGN